MKKSTKKKYASGDTHKPQPTGYDSSKLEPSISTDIPPKRPDMDAARAALNVPPADPADPPNPAAALGPPDPAAALGPPSNAPRFRRQNARRGSSKRKIKRKTKRKTKRKIKK